MIQLVLLLLLLLSISSSSIGATHLRQQQQARRYLQQTCDEIPSTGSPNGDECFLVDSITCRDDSTSTNGCTDLEGTYSYYLQNDVDPDTKIDLFTAVITTDTCGSPCLVRTTVHSSGRTLTFTCSASTDDSSGETTISFNSNHPRAHEIFGSTAQEFVFGEAGASYLRLAHDQNSCDYMNATPTPTATPGNPTTAPTTSPTMTTETPTESPTTEDIQTMAPTQATTDVPEDTIMPTLAQTMMISTTSPTSSPTVATPPSPPIPSNCIRQPNIDACLDPDTLDEAVPCQLDNQNEVDVTLCTTPVGSCVAMQVSYNYIDDEETSIQISTSVGCAAADTCSITVNGQTCNDCSVVGQNGNLEQVVTISETCSDILLWGLAPQTNPTTVFLNYNTDDGTAKSIGYFPLKSNHVTDCLFDETIPPTPAPDGGSTPSPTSILLESSQCFTDNDIPGCSQIDAETGNVITSDCGNDVDICYNVDISMSSKTYSSGCQELQATYDYGQANPSIIITSYQSCGSTDYCEVEIDGLICTDCSLELDTLDLGEDDSFQVQKVIVGSSCGNVGGTLEGYLPANQEQTLPYFNAGVGFLELDSSAVICLADTTVPTSSPSTTPATASPTIATVVSRKFDSDEDPPKSIKPKGGTGDNDAILLKTTFTLSLVDPVGSPTADEISILWDRTQNYIDDIMLDQYGMNGYKSSEIISPKDSQLSATQFQLTFTLQIYLEESVVGSIESQIRTTAQLLSKNTNLRRYVGVFARYTDDTQNTPNGYFQRTQKVFARIVGGKPEGVTDSGRRHLGGNYNDISYTGSSS